MKSSNDGKFDIGVIVSLVKKYKREIITGGVMLCLGIVLGLTISGKDKSTKPADTDPDAIEAMVNEAGEPIDEDEIQEEPNILEEDAYPEINTLIQTYYDSMAAGDLDTVRGLVDVLSEENQATIESYKTLIEGYQDIHCYTKRGMEEGDYLVFVRYDMKFVAVDTAVPGMDFQYVRTGENGNEYIFLGAADDALRAYVEEITQGADVQALRNEVNNAFEEAKAADEKLAENIGQLEKLRNGESAEVPDTEEETDEGEGTEEGQEEGEEPSSEGTSSEGTSSGSGTAVNKDTRFAETTNIRSGRSTESERIAVGYQGEKVTRIEDYSDGWSKISFNGKEGYCKTEYLE